MPFLPERCSSGLTLSAEPIASWADDCDLALFLGDLFDHDLVMKLPDGTVHRNNCREYGLDLYARGKASYLAKAVEFGASAQEHHFETLPDQGVPDIIPAFEQDPEFGRMAKYAIALDAVTTAMLEDGAFFSVAHTLEALSELECSVLLASRLYYKHALQVLRGFLELSVLHLAFAKYPDRFQRWQRRDPSFRIPSLRGSAQERGLLEQLEIEGAIPPDLRQQAELLYGRLNGAIHSNEARLIHRGTDAKTWVGLQFKQDQYLDWCGYFAQVVTVGVRLLAHMLTLHLGA